MDARVEPQGLLPAVAARVAAYFPDLKGRSLAVAEAEINKDNLPKLPLAMVALANAEPNGPVDLMQRTQFSNVDRFVIEFWFETNRYIKANNTETPFWAYYDYAAIRDTLLATFSGWTGPNGERIWYAGMTMDASEYAVVLTFNMQARYELCVERKDEDGDGKPFETVLGMCRPRTVYCPPETTEEEDPCLPT